MRRLAIERSVICPVQPEDYHLEPANEAIAAAVKTHPDRFRGFCRVDPRRKDRAVEELERSVQELDLAGLFLDPWEEGYPVNGKLVDPVIGAAARLDIPVMIAAGYPWYAHPLQVADLAGRFPDQTFIMTHGGQINISGLALQDAFAAMRDCPNISMEVSGVYRQDFIEAVIAAVGVERVMFGSNCPRMHQEFELERVRSLDLTEDERAQVLGANAARLLNLAA